MKTSPTARSKKHLRDRGLAVWRVEQRLAIPGKFVTQDAFNFGDLLVMGEGFGIALVQTTSTSNLSARTNKILDIEQVPLAPMWLFSGGKILLHGWAKRGKRGTRKTWQLVEREIVWRANRLQVVETEAEHGSS